MRLIFLSVCTLILLAPTTAGVAQRALALIDYQCTLDFEDSRVAALKMVHAIERVARDYTAGGG